MALTATLEEQNIFGNKRFHEFKLTFDSSYPLGGESLTPAMLGLGNIDRIWFESSSGCLFEYDKTNEKVKVLGNIPPIVFEETVTVTANVGVLRYPAAFIMSVSVTTQPYMPIPAGLVPAAKQVSVSNYTPTFTPGKTSLTFLAGDAVTTCVVTYATQAWRELVDNYVYAKLTAGARVYGHTSLSFTPGTPDEVSLGELAVAIGSILWSDAGVYKAIHPLYLGATAATTEGAVDFSDTGVTTINFLESDTMDTALDSIYIIYIKKPTAGFIADRFHEEDDLTPSSDVITLSPADTPSIPQALLFGTAGCFPGDTLKFATLIASSATIGTGATLVQPTLYFPTGITAQTFTLGSNHADTDHLKPSYIWGYPWEIQKVACEIGDLTDLTNLSDVRGFAIGC